LHLAILEIEISKIFQYFFQYLRRILKKVKISFMRYLFIVFGLFISFQSYSQILSLEVYTTGFTSPVDISHAGDERLFVVEKRGRIKIIDGDGNLMPNLFLDIDPIVTTNSNEQGLLGLAFHPDYQNNGYFFVNYTNNSGTTVVSRFSVTGDPNIADPGSEKIILTIQQPFNNHNAGDLNFGPDGYLYIAMGDGGSGGDPGNRSQDPQNLLGKMLRIDVDNGDPYSIPEDNPWAFDDFALDEIWSIGLRNPWRFSFDRATGDIWIADVGQSTWEEIDFQPVSSTGGENYGWRCYEAEQEFNTSECDLNNEFVFPVFAFDNNSEGCSVTGGYVYRGVEYPHLYGKYIFTDFCSGNFWLTQKDECGSFTTIKDLEASPFQYSSFGEDINGELYLASLGQGIISKITTHCTLAVEGQVQDASCVDIADGSITLTLSFAQNPVISWEGGATSDELTNLIAGNYSVTVTDDSGCSYTQCFEVKSNESIQTCGNANFEDILACPGEEVLLSSCEAPIDYNYTWILNGETMVGINDQTIVVDQAGIYQVQFVGGECDYAPSEEIGVSFYDLVNLTIDVDENVLTTQTGFVLYNWYNVNNSEPLQSSESNSYTATESGDYYVEAIDENGCLSQASDIVNITVHSIENIENLEELDINPNPFSNQLHISYRLKNPEDLSISIINLAGELLNVISLRNGISNEIEINTSDYLPGIYFIKIQTKDFSLHQKVVKQ
jgi:glucose/arabinose dehydrogenase